MDKFINTIQSQNYYASILNALSVKLGNIQTVNELALQKSSDLLSQIIACEARQDYINAALKESEAIVKEITTNASQRVSEIIVNAQNIVYPQQKQIECIKLEINELNVLLDTLAIENIESETEIIEIRPIESEYSQREPQDIDISEEDSEVYAEHNDANLEQFGQMANLPSEVQNNEMQQDAMDWNQAEESNSIMNFNADVEVRYFEKGPSERICNHDWQINIKIEVPLENDKFVGYGKVSSAVMSTLMRYDKVVLNDVYPFNIIEPNPENIAMYFYNCLDDELSLLDLIFKEITFVENNNMCMKCNKRNTEFDLLLQGGEYFFDDIRYKLCSLEEEQTSISTKLGQMFKSKR